MIESVPVSPNGAGSRRRPLVEDGVGHPVASRVVVASVVGSSDPGLPGHVGVGTGAADAVSAKGGAVGAELAGATGPAGPAGAEPPGDGTLRPRVRLGLGAVIVLVLLAFAATVVIGMIRGATGAEIVETTAPTGTAIAAPAMTGVYVHVAGAVRTPGLYRLDAGERVADAVARAGGFADDAARDGINLARVVSDGEQIVVPVVGASAPGATSGAAGAGAGGTAAAGGAGAGAAMIDLNTATRDELDTLPRVGPAMADRIIAWREANGRFTSVDDLLSVPGIGEKMLAGLRERVRV